MVFRVAFAQAAGAAYEPLTRAYDDGVIISRFGNDFLVYEQTLSAAVGGPTLVRPQMYSNLNLGIDGRREGWANL
jgi:hypothetical protein